MADEEVEMFEGKLVTKFEVILPRVTVDAAGHYRSGRNVRFATEMRVANVQFKDNKDGTLTRQHYLTWESVEVVSEFDPADQIIDGGSSSSTAKSESDDDLGITTGRTGGSWPDNVSQFPTAASE